MELAMEFATFCNICFYREGLRKLEENEHLLSNLMIFIEHKILIKGEKVYLCLNCCEKLESYNQFKEMCLKNFIHFRVEYFKLKNKLEKNNDPNVEKKLRHFIETRVCGASEYLELNGFEDTIKAESRVIPTQQSKSDLTKKQGEINDNSYDFDNVICKIEKRECEDNEEYKLHSELDLENIDNDSELSERDEQIKGKYDVEDIGTTKCNTKNNLIETSKYTGSYKRDETLHTSNKLTQASVRILDQNALSTNQEIGEIECNICRKKFVTIHTLKVHMRIHSGEKPFTCNICNKSFTVSGALKRHYVVHTGEKRYSCNMCNKTFSYRSNLKKHEREHTGEKPNVCSICNEAFSNSQKLKTHVLAHTDERPYTCDICNKNFKKLDYLKRHERVHTGEKPYACSICDKTFSNSGNMKIHELVHTGEKRYTCGVCDKSFRCITHLKVHERVHSGEKPYECTACNERFTQLHTYKIHKLTHTGEKPHSCTVCQKTFRQLTHLRLHERIHTGVKPYTCEICKKTFRQGSHLRLHKKRNHT